MVMFLDSHHTMSTFLNWFVLPGVALAFSISIRKYISNLLVTDITSFEKRGNYSDRTLNVYQNLVRYRFKNM